MHVVVPYSYTDNKRIVVQVVNTSRIIFQELNDEAFSPCYLWYRARQLDILDHSKVSFASLFGRPNSLCSPYDHPYVPYEGSRTLIIPSEGLLLRGWIYSLLADELLQFPLSDKGLNLLL